LKDEVDIYDIQQKLIAGFGINSFGSYEAVWDMLRDIRLLKYVRRNQLSGINKRYEKTCSDIKIDRLIELGLLKKTENDILISTAKSLQLLKQFGKNTKTYPKNPEGGGSINELNNTTVFIQALKLPDFFTLLYKDFGYIFPDALLVRGTRERYKLEFLEVEASKSNWHDWLENKRINYLKLAGDKRAYSYWKEQCELLDLPIPDIKDFKFSVSIVGKIKKDFGEGFRFVEQL
jgi:hypothetical protein